MAVTAKKWVLAQKPNGTPTLQDFLCLTEEIRECQDGEVLLESEYLTVDPYMRVAINRMNVDEVMIGGTVSKVIQSKNSEYPVGTRMVVYCGWRSHFLMTKESFSSKSMVHYKLFPEMGNYPPSTALGVLGMPGISAYFGLLPICDPKEGEVVVVNAAAGAVGSIVCQIAKIKGCKVIGFAGDEAKVSWLKELGIDRAANYKTDDIQEVLAQEAPNGINVYFDNVGGDFTRKVMPHMAPHGRISVCGAISIYNDTKKSTSGPFDSETIIFKELKIQGFYVTTFFNTWREAVKVLKGWLDQDKLKYKETFYKGFESMPTAFLGLFKGDNIGKAVISIK